jgi:hypothetical protein
MPQFKFGRIPSPPDARDYRLSSFISPRKLDVTGTKVWDFLSGPLDQGDTPHCVGFAMANFGINLPIQTAYTNENGHAFYRKCKIVDGDPNGEDGSYLRSAAKVLKAMGIIESYAFAQSTDEISWWLLNKGPVMVGTNWTSGMCVADEDNIVRPTGDVAGGHAYLINDKAYNCDIDLYGIQNSWDGYWGINGKAYISIADFSILFRQGGEAIAAVETIPNALNKSVGDGCLNAILKAFGLSQT